jgi:hypothetical protein
VCINKRTVASRRVEVDQWSDARPVPIAREGVDFWLYGTIEEAQRLPGLTLAKQFGPGLSP